VLLTGCGGDTSYSAGQSSLCLGRIGIVSTRDHDTVGALASSGSYQVTIGRKVLHIAFGKDTEEARELLTDYGAVARGMPDRLYRKGNAVLAWEDEPGAARKLVEDCLRR
jgi:hypothetical protein